VCQAARPCVAQNDNDNETTAFLLSFFFVSVSGLENEKVMKMKVKKTLTCGPADPLTPLLTANAISDKRAYAAHWSSSVRSVDNWIAKGLPCLRIGKRKVRILTSEADAWMVNTFGSQRRAA
jgi:hypothetical protein